MLTSKTVRKSDVWPQNQRRPRMTAPDAPDASATTLKMLTNVDIPDLAQICRPVPWPAAEAVSRREALRRGSVSLQLHGFETSPRLPLFSAALSLTAQ